jgi:hypothetical protein
MKTYYVITSPLGIMPPEPRIRCSIVILLVGILANLLPVIASAQTTQITLFNTGVDSSSVPLTPLGSVDPHWSIVPPSPGYTTPASAFTLSSPNGAYVQSASSEWIWLNSAGHTPVNAFSPNYYFRQTFFLPPGSNLATAFITGSWGVDNGGVIQLNGVSATGVGTALTGGLTGNFTQFHTFTINSGFVLGLNTLDFKVNNISGVAGLNITNLSGSVDVVPEPASLSLVLVAGLAMPFWARRFRRRHA